MVQNLKISQLVLNTGQVDGLPQNPRFIRDERFNKLVKSIQDAPELLDYRTLLVYPFGGKYVVICGNMRLRACKQIGYKELPCYVLPADTTPDKLREYAIKDNVSFGSDDFDILANEWNSVELADWGVEFPSVNLEDLNADEPEVEDDNFDENKIDVEKRCEKGDIWQCGNHRLMCGDSTSQTDVVELMDGNKADIAFYSPPYNAGFGANLTKDNGRSKYTNGSEDNLNATEYADFLEKTIENATEYADFNFCNIQFLANNKFSIIDVLNRCQKTLADILIWDKGRSQPQLAANVLNSQFEFVFCFSKKGNRAIGKKHFHGTLPNIFQISPSKNEYAAEHNAVFPLELPAHFIQNFSEQSVLDLFGGTGTTMIAAEQLGRKCFMMELDPHYCDIILARWEKQTGGKATKVNV